MAVEEIKEFDEDLLDELLAFLVKSEPDHPELGDKDRFIWQRYHHYISRYKGKIAGYMLQIPHIFRYGKKKGKKGVEHIGWGVALILENPESSSSSSLRRSAFAHELIAKCESNPPWQFTGCGMIPEIEKVYSKRGLVIRENCSKMYARFLNPSKGLRYQGKSTIYAPAIKIANAFVRPRKNVRFGTVERIEKFKPEWDEKWDNLLAKQYELYGIRNAEFLNYKLTQPNREYHVYLHSDGGYIIFRHASHRIKDLNLVKVCDLIGTDKARTDLLSLAVKFAYDIKAYGIAALGSYDDEGMYKKGGLYISRPYPIAMPAQISARMHISFFDSDLDNLW